MCDQVSMCSLPRRCDTVVSLSRASQLFASSSLRRSCIFFVSGVAVAYLLFVGSVCLLPLRWICLFTSFSLDLFVHCLLVRSVCLRPLRWICLFTASSFDLFAYFLFVGSVCFLPSRWICLFTSSSFDLFVYFLFVGSVFFTSSSLDLRRLAG